MTDFIAKIRAKGLDGTGVDENLAREMFTSKGKHYMAIVELKVDEIHEKVDGQRRVDLVITQVEPATSKDLDDHLRNITRTTYQNRALKSEDAQLQIETAEDLEPTVEQVIAAGHQHIAETDDALDLDEDQSEEEDPYAFVHAKGSTELDAETSCGLNAAIGKTLRTHQEDDQVTCPDCLAALHVDAGDEPWEYDQPEPDAATVPDPIASPFVNAT